MLADLESGVNDVAERHIFTPKAITNGHKAQVAASKPRLRIRIAAAHEAPAIVTLTDGIFFGKDHFPPPGFASASGVEQLMNRGKFLLAESEKEIIGCAYVELRLEASRLELLAVAPSQRRTGIGSQLLEAAERLSSSMQCLFMHLRVMNLHWQMLRFCRQRGYVEFGIESLSGDQPISLHRHFIRMCKRLKADCAVL